MSYFLWKRYLRCLTGFWIRLRINLLNKDVIFAPSLKFYLTIAHWWVFATSPVNHKIIERHKKAWKVTYNDETDMLARNAEYAIHHCVKSVRIRSYSDPQFSRIFLHSGRPHLDRILSDTEYRQCMCMFYHQNVNATSTEFLWTI